ncbi:MAG: antibiotic resistance protein VanZ [Thermotogaceae bacterium]|jgi:VanZ family protein|nr:antibiotic resistance protein VanZ [Mesotoga sp.]NLX33583.1 antibiotic resistance protein VanZ [Thermotogaceae bacterium]MDD5743711.1 antibiotic resistance protein VanZ [Mesotoga sp.]HOY26990.1 antibiotic resistance protein VanZ [Mesotoga sp.]HPB63359.1 antibiotic resistance protein VanZ [Mesotoga sp.]
MRKLIVPLTTALYLSVIIYFYLAPARSGLIIGSDKFMHFSGFFAGGLWLSLIHLLKTHRVNLLVVSIFLITGPVVLEMLQKFSPGRSVDPLDILANYLGWLVPVSLYAFIKLIRSVIL